MDNNIMEMRGTDAPHDYCTECAMDVEPLGQKGSTVWFRCLNCGTEWCRNYDELVAEVEEHGGCGV